MVDLWMPGAARHDVGDHAPTDAQYPPRVIAHITWDKNAGAAGLPHVSFEALLNYFTGGGVGMAPHLLWDPFTGQIAQFYPADSRSKSVVDQPGGTRTNRAGKYVIQIEAVFFPNTVWNGKVYARLTDTPCKGWDQINAWTQSLGIPNVWPMGKPSGYVPRRNERIWETEGGFYMHGDVPENDHIDAGYWPDFVSDAPPFPGAAAFDGSVTVGAEWAQKGLVKRGHSLTVTCKWDAPSKSAWAEEQRGMGFSGSDADGIPGQSSWDHVMAGFDPVEEDMTPDQSQALSDIHKAVVEASLKSAINGEAHTLGQHEVATNFYASDTRDKVAALADQVAALTKTVQAIAAKVGA
jgi:hypothetical protein